MDTDFELFKGKSFKDLCKDIYNNQESRKSQIEIVINDLRPLIKTSNDALMIVPLIKGYIDSANVNDQHLIRLAAIIQKLITVPADGPGGTSGLSEEEKKELMKEINAIKESDKEIADKLENSLEDKV